jgi:hypothetical protein
MHRGWRRALLAALLLLVPGGVARAQEEVLLNSGGKDLWLATGFKLRPFVSDQVEDDCLTQPARLEDVASQALRAQDLYRASAPRHFTVWVYGYAISTLYCVVGVNASVSTTVYAEAPRLKLPDPASLGRSERASLEATLWTGTQLLSGPDAGLQDRVEAAVKDLVGKYAAEVAAAKNRVRAQDPGWLEKGPRD